MRQLMILLAMSTAFTQMGYSQAESFIQFLDDHTGSGELEKSILLSVENCSDETGGTYWHDCDFAIKKTAQSGVSADDLELFKINKLGQVQVNNKLIITVPQTNNVGIHLDGTQLINAHSHDVGLHVNGLTRVQPSPNSAQFELRDNGSNELYLEAVNVTNSTSAEMHLAGRFGTDTKVVVHGDIEVTGAVTTNKWKVAALGAPDYVFEPDYDLKPLHEVEDFIRRNRHLPEVPSAKEIEKGVDMVQLNFKLLEKIEELTLHTIEQEKRFKEQEKRIEKMESLLNNVMKP